MRLPYIPFDDRVERFSQGKPIQYKIIWEHCDTRFPVCPRWGHVVVGIVSTPDEIANVVLEVARRDPQLSNDDMRLSWSVCGSMVTRGYGWVNVFSLPSNSFWSPRELYHRFRIEMEYRTDDLFYDHEPTTMKYK
jgi:hypothetical protein